MPFEFRLLFIGLWTLADKSGRLEYRPKRIKMQIFPGDNVDVTVGLTLLDRDGFVKLYTVDDQQYIQVSNWDKHQAPHHTEKKSTLPGPGCNGALTVNSRNHLRGNPPDSLIPDSVNQEQIPLIESTIPPPADPPDQDPIWTECLEIITAGGIAVKDARRLIGMWLKTHERDDVLQAIQSSVAKADPRSYVMGILKGRPKKAAGEAAKMLDALRKQHGPDIKLTKDGRQFTDGVKKWTLTGERVVSI